MALPSAGHSSSRGTRHPFGFQTLPAPVVAGAQPAVNRAVVHLQACDDILGALGCLDSAHGIDVNFLQPLVGIASCALWPSFIALGALWARLCPQRSAPFVDMDQSQHRKHALGIPGKWELGAAMRVASPMEPPDSFRPLASSSSPTRAKMVAPRW
jgi:hypothetical protein